MSAKRDGEAARRILAENRRARRDYSFGETLEAGLILLGSEVKSLRSGRANIAEAYVSFSGADAHLVNAHIPSYGNAAHFAHEERRNRKLLLSRREINRFAAGVDRKGMTVVPLRMYFNSRGLAKIEIALAVGKKTHDRRETQKRRDWQRQKERLLRRGE